MAESSTAEKATQINKFSYKSKNLSSKKSEEYTFNISQKDYLDIINNKVKELLKLQTENTNYLVPKNPIYVIPDVNGDFLSFYGSIILSGAFEIIENKYVFYDVENNEIIYKPDEVNIKNKYILLPELKLNDTWEGNLIALGNYIGRGCESQINLALIKYISETEGLKNANITFLPGNQEITENNCPDKKYYINQFKNFNYLEPSVIIQKADGNYICFSHSELTKNDLKIMFEFYYDTLIKNFESEKLTRLIFIDEFKASFDNISIVLKNKIEIFFKTVQIDSFFGEMNVNNIYTILKKNGFEDIDFFHMRDFIIKMVMQLRFNEKFLCVDVDKNFNNIWSGWLDKKSPWYIAANSKESIKENNSLLFSTVDQYVGYSPVEKVIKSANCNYLHVGFSYLGKTSKNSIVGPFIIDTNSNEILGLHFSVKRQEINGKKSRIIRLSKRRVRKSINCYLVLVQSDAQISKLEIEISSEEAEAAKKIEKIEKERLEQEKQQQKSNNKSKKITLRILAGIGAAGAIITGIALGIFSVLAWPFAAAIISGGALIGAIWAGIEFINYRYETNSLNEVNSSEPKEDISAKSQSLFKLINFQSDKSDEQPNITTDDKKIDNSQIPQ